ncbi:hypothetical protein K7432_003811 [Basidiobolus ranarum]|uniref:SH3 domain-containing protein n=1 Tax=Basidiobolus ranarum TaxID=34480 RepID=A0ABR2WZ74_9FUNG
MKSHLVLLATTLLAGSITSQNVTTDNISDNLPQVDYKLCAPSFSYKEREYLGCIEVDSIGKPWCELAKPYGKAKQTRGFCQVDTIPKAMSINAKGIAVECNPFSNTPSGKVLGCYTEGAKSKKFLCDVGNKPVTCEGLQSNKNPTDHQSKDPNLELVGKKPAKQLEQGKGEATTAADPHATQANASGESVPKGLIAGLASAGCVGLLAVGLFVVRKRSTSRQLKARLNESAALESIHSDLPLAARAPMEKSVSAKGPFLVVSTYTPTLGDEIEVLPGDMVTLLLEYDDGWAQGINETRGKVKGVFPKHCLEPWA